jgi:ATP-dependent HslUV protease ATP-binding subunit HslU
LSRLDNRFGKIERELNEKTENIGARRLHTVMEKLLEEVSFEAGKVGLDKVAVDAAYVNEKLGEVAADEDLSRYVL